MSRSFVAFLQIIFFTLTVRQCLAMPTLASRGDLPAQGGYPSSTYQTHPNGLYYPHEICSTFRAIEIVTSNFTRAIQRLDDRFDVHAEGLWLDKGLALQDWFFQLHRWDSMIRELNYRLDQTEKWPKEIQVEAASCYADYWLHTMETLKLLEDFRYRYPWNGDFLCMVYNILSKIHLSYRDTARQLYVIHRFSDYGLLEGQFPPRYPEWWCIPECGRKPKPKPLGIIAEWAYWHDLPIKRVGPDERGTFNHTLREWTCWNRTFVHDNKTMEWTGLEDWVGNQDGR